MLEELRKINGLVTQDAKIIDKLQKYEDDYRLGKFSKTEYASLMNDMKALIEETGLGRKAEIHRLFIRAIDRIIGV